MKYLRESYSHIRKFVKRFVIRRWNYYTLLIALCIGLVSCFSTRDLSNRNFSNVYRKTDQVFHPEFSVSHLSDTSSLLYVKVLPMEFLYMRQPDDRFMASFSVRCGIIESYEATSVIDSSVKTFEISREESALPKVFAVPFSLPPNGRTAGQEGKSLLLITVNDNKKNYSEDFFVNIDNSSRQSRQSFLVNAINDTTPLFRNYLNEKDTVSITYRDSSVKALLVNYYHRDFPLAVPPFSFNSHDEFNYKPDSAFDYEISKPISFRQEGFYHFRVDTSDKNGVTLFRFANSFPNITSPEQMIETVRYLTTKREFEEMKSNPNKKLAMDKFWVDIGGNPERTKALIKKYYTRVQEANRYFSTHTEGWRTDRGMIYIIFGKPNNVYKSANAESWVYGQINNALSLNFFFVRVNNPFTDNDYTLTREPLYEGSWYRAVDVWRQGRAYNDY